MKQQFYRFLPIIIAIFMFIGGWVIHGTKFSLYLTHILHIDFPALILLIIVIFVVPIIDFLSLFMQKIRDSDNIKLWSSIMGIELEGKNFEKGINIDTAQQTSTSNNFRDNFIFLGNHYLEGGKFAEAYYQYNFAFLLKPSVLVAYRRLFSIVSHIECTDSPLPAPNPIRLLLDEAYKVAMTTNDYDLDAPRRLLKDLLIELEKETKGFNEQRLIRELPEKFREMERVINAYYT